MPIILDHSLKEYIPHNAVDFPITYFHDEPVTMPNGRATRIELSRQIRLQRSA